MLEEASGMTSWMYTVGSVVALLAFIYYSAPAEQQNTVQVQATAAPEVNWSGVSDNAYFGAVSGNFTGTWVNVSTGLVNMSGNFTGSFQYQNATRPCELQVTGGLFTGVYALEKGVVVNMSGSASEWNMKGRFSPTAVTAAQDGSNWNFILLVIILAGAAYFLGKYQRKRKYLDDRTIDGKLRKWLKEADAEGEGYSLIMWRVLEHHSIPKIDPLIRVLYFQLSGRERGEYCAITYDISRDIFYDFKRVHQYHDFRDEVAKKTVFVDEIKTGRSEKPLTIQNKEEKK